MNHTHHAAAAAAMIALIVLAACSKPKPQTIILTQKPAAAAPADTKPREMGDYQQTRRVEWRGSTLTIETTLRADKSLPMATDGARKYYDNRISLRIVRADGTVFFTRTFTKADFRELVPTQYYKTGALLGIVFDRADAGQLRFAASVGNPDKSSDEYVPLVVGITPQGAVTMSRDTQLDTGTTTEQEEEDGV